MHQWGDEKVDWQGIDDAGAYIGYWLRKWARMDIRCVKEKFGTVRIYCGFGWHGIHSIVRPGYVWYPKWWPMKLDFWINDTWAFRQINRLVVYLQTKAYVWRYKKAVQKWPHLYKEILADADYGELFEGKIPGYKHSDFWTSYPLPTEE